MLAAGQSERGSRSGFPCHGRGIFAERKDRHIRLLRQLNGCGNVFVRCIQNVCAFQVVDAGIPEFLRQRMAQRYRVFGVALRAPRTDHVGSIIGERTD